MPYLSIPWTTRINGYVPQSSISILTVLRRNQSKNYGFEMTYLTNTDILRGYRRQSIFMKDGRVVELTWRENMQGIERISVTCMGREIDYINPLR